MLHRLEMKMMLLINSERETFSSVHHDVMIDDDGVWCLVFGVVVA